MPVSEQTYLQVALEDPEGHWELHCGQLRSKPSTTAEHNDLYAELGVMLRLQLNRREYRVRFNGGQVRRSASRYYIPDLMVIPAAAERGQRVQPGRVEIYSDPLPLVVEVWSQSTRTYDVDEKLPENQQRGDREIWLLHPYDKTLTAWVRRPDGSYTETLHRGGIVRPTALPNVAIDLDALFTG